MAFCLFLVGFGLMFGVALSDRARGAEVESSVSSEISSEDAESAGDSENSGDDESSGGDSRKDDSASEKTPEFSDFSGLDGKRVAMLSGAPFADQVDKVVKDAKYSYYDSFADIILALEANKIDAALNNSAVAEYQANKDERLAVMVDPLQEMDFGIAFKKGSDQDIHSEGDLEGKIVGAQAGSTSEIYLNENGDLKNTLKEFKTYLRFKDGINSLKSDDIDVFVCDELVARYEMNTNPDQLEIIDVKTGFVTEVGIGFPKENVELRDKVQNVFDEMIKDGTAKKISEKWFNADLIKQ